LVGACTFQALSVLSKMTGSDIDSNFHLLWQYANGSLPPDQFEACIESAKVGFDKLLEEIKIPQDRAVADYHGSRWNIDTTILTCASCGIRHEEDLLGGRLFSSDELGLLKYMDAIVVLPSLFEQLASLQFLRQLRTTVLFVQQELLFLEQKDFEQQPALLEPAVEIDQELLLLKHFEQQPASLQLMQQHQSMKGFVAEL
jgi:hypothetical protein